MFQESFKGVSGKFYGSFKGVSRKIRGHFNVIYKEVLKVFQESFKGISRKFKWTLKGFVQSVRLRFVCRCKHILRIAHTPGFQQKFWPTVAKIKSSINFWPNIKNDGQIWKMYEDVLRVCQGCSRVFLEGFQGVSRMFKGD